MFTAEISALWDRYYAITKDDQSNIVRGKDREDLIALIKTAPIQRKDQTEFVEGYWSYEHDRGTRYVEISLHQPTGECCMCDQDHDEIERKRV
jgi:hypothetical protein